MGKRKTPLLKQLKRGLTSLFVCLIVVGPVVLLRQVPREFKIVHLEKPAASAAALPNFAARPIDSTPPNLFNEPLITVAFDDGWASTYKVAAPIFMKDGIRSTQYVLSGMVNDSAYMNTAEIKALAAHQQEIACHTVNHPDLTKLDNAQLNYQLATCQTYFQKLLGAPITDFASPYGASSAVTIGAVKKYYQSHRNTYGDLTNGIDDNDVNVPSNFDPYNITAIAVRHDTTMAQIQGVVEYAKAHNAWVVFTYHQADDGKAETFSYDNKAFTEQMNYLSSQPVKIVTVHQVIANLPAAH